jgi:uncharacterized glyoxalase superfamily protein PhnB
MNTVFNRLHLVTLGVKDFERSLSFYQDGLGWQPSTASGEDVAFFQLGGMVLALYPRHKLAEDASVPAEGSGFPGFSLAYNARSREEVDQVFSAVERLGATIAKRPQDVFWGGYSGYFTDPDGFYWEVAWNPFFPFDEQGHLKLP